ncbi:hypothetical protein SSX86_027955 [Deinandra increscens subsp. villosa]|uniref:F-box domain-containing protein n=1 Tax=Deinandra increscens subsp. villosa TaxID=3103831 RepID=A0AAP0GIV6_9ASTR
MVSTRAKIKKTQATFKTYPSHPSDSDQQSTPSGALVASNDDLLTEILLRLPVTSILRFKSVSKHWQCLLTHKSFTLRFDNHSKSPGLFAGNVYVPFHVENSNPPFRSLDFCFDPRGIRIEQSCNGLLLCCSDGGNRSARKYYVFNPTTKQFAIIPSVPGGRNARKSIIFMGLAFHQTLCARYKLVCFLGRLEKACRIQIFSSETWTWKVSIESFSTNWPYFFNGVYWNGAFYCYPFHPGHSYFNVETEQLQTMPLTPRMEASGDRYHGLVPVYFGESGGRLHLIEAAYCNSLHLVVCEMLSDHSGWFVKYRVELDELAGAFPEVNGWMCYRFYDTFMVLSIPGKMIKYNVHDKSFEHIFSFNDKKHVVPLQAHRYIESLASL